VNQLLSVLFPESEESSEEPLQKHAKLMPAMLDAVRQGVRGPATASHQVYNRFAHFWNLVDRINEDFHGFHHLPGGYSALKHGLESAIFLAIMAARVIWEEHRCARAYALAGQSKRAVEAVQRRTIPEFIVAAAQQLALKKQ
jgi:hypothetical protein